MEHEEELRSDIKIGLMVANRPRLHSYAGVGQRRRRTQSDAPILAQHLTVSIFRRWRYIKPDGTDASKAEVEEWLAGCLESIPVEEVKGVGAKIFDERDVAIMLITTRILEGLKARYEPIYTPAEPYPKTGGIKY